MVRIRPEGDTGIRQPGLPRRPLGVSLIELLIVVVLISTLVGGAAVYYDQVIAERRVGKARTELIQLAKALKAYESRTGKVIRETISVPGAGEPKPFKLDQLKTEQVMEDIPLDPWGYDYAIDVNRGAVICGGPDNEIGTADDLEHQFKPPFQAERVRYNKRAKMVHVTFSRAIDASTVTSGTIFLEPSEDNEKVSTSVVNLSNMYEARVLLDDHLDPGTLGDVKVQVKTDVVAFDGTPLGEDQELPLVKP